MQQYYIEYATKLTSKDFTDETVRNVLQSLFKKKKASHKISQPT